MRIPRPTYSNVVATLALFVALGGTSYAALNLPRGSVGTPQLRSASVTLPKLAFPLEVAAGTLGHAIGVGEQTPQCGPRGPGEPLCSYPPPRPPRTIAVATLKLRRPTKVLILGSLSVHQPTPRIQSGEGDRVEVGGDANVPAPILNAADGYSATVTGEQVVTEQPGTHRYYLRAGGYVSAPTTVEAAQIVAIALPGGEITSCPSAPACTR